MGTLRVGTVFPDPPFTGMDGDAGLDIDLMTAIADHLGDSAEFIRYDGADPDGVFGALTDGTVACVAAGASVTPMREQQVSFAPPYLISGQALAVDTARLPHVHGIADVDGLTIGVQRGSTACDTADQLAGRATVRRYDDTGAALADLRAGRCDAVMALAPVLAELVRPHQGVEVVQKGLSTEHIAIAVARHDQQLLSRITVAQAELEDDGTLQQIRRKWLGNPYADQTLAVH
ncbi:amino acid ABC transporter substrate-binding protein [Mycobacterium sp. PS03-16]|uniref:ABC transporter substrate-binding protein n=1 Tax=Mycobacterium sp. PS03-16 TaxID=2559611 RepID=UPI001073A3E4|nr:ABC transporter substrate-binding protein [Mycobacterium sp. PS03-16]TFV58930.1 amino acid ABC transporter substrate-binding protein [Mycobacterium sp. PS03-16]